MHTRGFTLVELLVVIGIIGMLATLATMNFSEHRKTTTLSTTAERIVAEIERARSDAIAGKGGEEQGVFFTEHSYTRFSGDDYNAGDAGMTEVTLDSLLVLDTSLSDDTLVFSRIFGTPDDTATITIAIAEDLTTFTQIVVGVRGDVTLIRE